MLFETSNQPQIFLLLVIAGFFCGFVYDMSTYIIFLCKKNKVVQIIFDFIASIAVFAIFYACVLFWDYGEMRFFHFFAFFSSLVFQRYTLGKFIAKLFDKCYNLFIKLFENIVKGAQKLKWKKKHNKQP